MACVGQDLPIVRMVLLQARTIHHHVDAWRAKRLVTGQCPVWNLNPQVAVQYSVTGTDNPVIGQAMAFPGFSSHIHLSDGGYKTQDINSPGCGVV